MSSMISVVSRARPTPQLRLHRAVLSSRSIATSSSRPSVTLEAGGIRLVAVGGSGTPQEPLFFPYGWLRDSDPQLIHPHTKQKLHSTSEIPNERPLEASISSDRQSLNVKWSGNPGGPWPISSSFPIDFLLRWSEPKLVRAFHHEISPIPWSRSVIESSPNLFVEYPNLMQSDQTLHDAASQLITYGLLFVRNTPHQETSDELCEIAKLAERFGRIRDTFYGRTWDVQSRGAAARNAAYTNLNLGLHGDLQYFEAPPRYQILHMLRNRGVKGGDSIFSDAFKAAYTLRDQDPQAFDTLATEPVAFHYMNDNHHLYREHPTIELAPPGSHQYLSEFDSGSNSRPPPIQYINYSPPFQAPLPLRTASNAHFFPSFSAFSSLLVSPSSLYTYQLREGDAVIFDNRRILHGRKEFENSSTKEWTGAQDVEEGTRWLKGTYLEPEGVLDRLSVLEDRLARDGRLD